MRTFTRSSELRSWSFRTLVNERRKRVDYLDYLLDVTCEGFDGGHTRMTYWEVKDIEREMRKRCS